MTTITFITPAEAELERQRLPLFRLTIASFIFSFLYMVSGFFGWYWPIAGGLATAVLSVLLGIRLRSVTAITYQGNNTAYVPLGTIMKWFSIAAALVCHGSMITFVASMLYHIIMPTPQAYSTCYNYYGGCPSSSYYAGGYGGMGIGYTIVCLMSGFGLLCSTVVFIFFVIFIGRSAGFQETVEKHLATGPLEVPLMAAVHVGSIQQQQQQQHSPMQIIPQYQPPAPQQQSPQQPSSSQQPPQPQQPPQQRQEAAGGYIPPMNMASASACQ